VFFFSLSSYFFWYNLKVRTLIRCRFPLPTPPTKKKILRKREREKEKKTNARTKNKRKTEKRPKKKKTLMRKKIGCFPFVGGLLPVLFLL
jgi:hypothetical protein